MKSAGMRSLVWLIIGLLAAAGCAPTRPPVSGEPGVLFQDDFSQPTSGWDVHDDAVITTRYDNGQYLMAFNDVGKDIWALPGLDLGHLALEVDTAYAGGPENNEYGVICRYSASGDRHSFYFFFISSDGYFALGKVVKNRRTVLDPAGGDFQPSSAIKTEKTAVNHLSATCNGDQMSFAVNGTVVGGFTDFDLARGDIGLILGTYDQPGAQMRFDNLVVRKP